MFLVIAVIFASNETFANKNFELSGKIRVTKVTDGDSLRSGQLRIRIFGIDAPELEQQCHDKKGKLWPCGIVARDSLASLINDQEYLFCHIKDVDYFGRMVMQCFIDNIDIGSLMVRSGMALAYRKFSKIYNADELHAKRKKVGVWNGSFSVPWEWRKQK